ncbi:hypothetical protein GCM10010116_11350 [Microbispora rosea subsp. aerata]|nr:hypothetical protein GCM10010116_11350 [Microbispora rosea subsp. aerata]GIH55256.1 hypothetical protein Mro02_21700 [Microbispora rosea subsp. aerata]GLJ82706.1 hypothetical protein GCM10017588_14310 [Microbispora rosea subsp. aerata]
MLWAAAALIAVAPTLNFRVTSILTGDDTVERFMWVIPISGPCLGQDIHDLVYSHAYAVFDFPLFSYDGVPLIALGFAGWCLSLRRGRAGLARIIGRCVAVVLLVLSLPDVLLPALDSALGGSTCLEAWGPPEVYFAQIGWGLYDCVPPLLVLSAVRAPRRAYVRRGPVARTTTIVLAATMVVLLPAASAAPGKVSTSRELDCTGFGDGTFTGLSEADKRFLCEVRGYGLLYASRVERWDGVSDQDLLNQGRHLCALATRHGGDINARAVQEAPQASLAPALPILCPAVARAQEAEEAREQAELDAYVARKERACAAHPRHHPKIRPVRQRRATLWTEFWTINGWEDGYGGDPPDLVKNLMGGGRGALAIWAADEVGHACVTVESYNRRPPLETRGWEEVVEVGYESPTGSLRLQGMDGPALKGLLTRGPGSYHVRVHLRGRELVTQTIDPPDGAVELLVMMFPGTGKKPVVYK